MNKGEENTQDSQIKEKGKGELCTVNICGEFFQFFFAPLVEIFCGRIYRKETADILLKREESTFKSQCEGTAQLAILVVQLVEHQPRSLVVVGLSPIQDSSEFLSSPGFSPAG